MDNNGVENIGRVPTLDELKAFFTHSAQTWTVLEIAEICGCKQSSHLRNRLALLVASGVLIRVPAWNRKTARTAHGYMDAKRQLSLPF